ncbi:hypothetical protein SLS62_001408 [Diatrype stigma]|uniref:Uncharacterized protein n=1 Tax=Diatrype stigma TaxID=117547 RepID=A0AAN9UZZ3_9PEZI
MGHHRSRQSSSGSYHAVQLLREARDAVRYSITDTIYHRDSKGRKSLASSKKVYSPDVLKYHVHGAEGQIWTNLGSWTEGRVDAIDFGSKPRKERKEKNSTHRDLDDISRRFDRAVSISTTPRTPPPPPSLSATHPPVPSTEQWEDLPDLPPAYSQLSNLPDSGVVFGNRNLAYRDGAPVYEVVYPEDNKPAAAYESSSYTYTPRTGGLGMMADMKCRRKLPVFFVPDDDKEMQERGQGNWAAAEDSEKNDPYLVPEASVETNIKQCPYLRQRHGLGSTVTS